MLTTFDPPELANEQLLMRRQFTYSMNALKAGQQVFDTYIPYPSVTRALESIDRIHQLAEQISLTQGLMITGPTGTGKTTLIRYFQASLPPDGRVDENARSLYIRLQEQPSAGRIVSALLREIRYPFSSVSNQNLGIKRDILIEALQQRRCKLLFIDEAHYLCQSRKGRNPDRVGTYTTDLLREIADGVPLALVLTGEKTLDRLAEVDSHMAARVPVRVALANFEPMDRDWISIVMALMRACPEVSFEKLLDKPELHRIHNATGGNMRLLKWLLSEAVMVTVDAGQKMTRKEDMALAFDRLNGTTDQLRNPWRN